MSPFVSSSPSASFPRVIGHRGACGSAPENTLASLARAAELGAQAVEFDVTLTRDGVPVLLHDEDVCRTTDGGGQISDFDFADLQALDAGAWFDVSFRGERVPALFEALTLIQAKGLRANMELKPTPGREAQTARAAADVIKSSWTRSEPVLVSSFSPEALAAYRAEVPGALLGLNVETVPHDWREQVQALGCASLHCPEEEASPGLVAGVHGAGARLNVFTVNDEVRAHALFEMGVDGLFTDVPDVILAYALNS